MTAAALLGKGAILKVHDGALGINDPAAYATIAELRSVPFPQRQAARLDVTTHDTPGTDRAYVNGLTDLPAVRFQINWLPANPTHDETTGLLGLQISGAKRYFKLALPAVVTPAKVFTWQAQVSQFNPTVPVDNVMTVDVELQPNAAPTIGTS
jgi:hypothetical protein